MDWCSVWLWDSLWDADLQGNIPALCKYGPQKTNSFFRGGQIFGAAFMSFMHGAQDGQKFIGVLFLGVAFCNGQNSVKV